MTVKRELKVVLGRVTLFSSFKGASQSQRSPPAYFSSRNCHIIFRHRIFWDNPEASAVNQRKLFQTQGKYF